MVGRLSKKPPEQGGVNIVQKKMISPREKPQEEELKETQLKGL